MRRRTPAMPLTPLALALAVLASAAGLNAASASSLPDGAKLDSRALAKHIDEAIDVPLRADKVTPSPRCDDAEFVRRVYLDITGHIPSAEKAAAFLDSREPDKRAKLIDE